ncbi:helix-turn-helix domain-containing protein [Pusillimonas sp. ANT_WB101]|uniref:helix-turn-helix domain-containing protein n=1 Tax=Pusillimonas sp. ANT_WB101 TaxID=2597356 RepID=UPI00351A8682
MLMEDLPHRLRALRRQHNLSLEKLGEQTGLTKSYLSKLERGLSEPSISTVLKLADAYGIGVSRLIGSSEDGEDDSVSVVRQAEREPLTRHGNEDGYRYEAIAGKRLLKAMDPFIVHPPRKNAARPVAFPHRGEEFMFILKGSVHFTVGSKSFDLSAGDSVYFDSELPHQLHTTSKENAEVLVVASKSH